MSTNDKLNKGFQNIAQTSDQRSNSEELLSRFSTVPAEKSLQAAKVIGDLKGSWIQSSSIANQVSEGLVRGLSGSENNRYFSLGQLNFPEINFRPYDFGTNRSGDKCPSLLGHPISFEIVGPTIRSSALDLQWLVTDYSATPNGDVLTIDPQSIFSPPLGPSDPSKTTTIESTYGFNTLTGFEGGLYIIISQTATEGDYLGSPGGLPDGYFYDLTGNYEAISPLTPESKFEIFRVEDVGLDFLELDPSKRLANFFNIPSAPNIPVLRSITLLRPRVSRMITVPSSSSPKNRASVYAILPPETSLNCDFLPPYDGGNPSDGTWLQGGFETFGGTGVGDASAYNENVRLPSNKILKEIEGSLFDEGNVNLPSLNIGYWSVQINAADVDSNHVGKILRIVEIRKSITITPSNEDGFELNNLPRGSYSYDSILGFFEIVSVDVSDNFYTLRRICEFNPLTGKLNFGDPEGLLTPPSGIQNYNVAFKAYIYESVYNLHRTPQLDLEALRSSILHTIINPAWITPALQPSKGEGSNFTIFNTKTNENPGNLLNLGFTPVFYPAKAGSSPGEIIPDWDNPFYPGKLILNPSVDSEQYLEVDYNSGLVYLSENPLPGSGCVIAPNDIITSATHNPRNEIILYISCVPFSRETLKSSSGINLNVELQKGNSTSLFGSKKSYPIKGHVDGVFVHQEDFSGTNFEIPLAIEHDQDDLPDSGKFYFYLENSPFSIKSNLDYNLIYGYYGKRYSTDSLTGKDYVSLLGVYGGDTTIPAASGNVQDGNYSIVPLKNIPDYSQHPTQNSTQIIAQDYSYGSSLKLNHLKINKSSGVINNNGGLDITFSEYDGHREIFNGLMEISLISGGDILSTANLFLILSSIQGTLGGVEFQLPSYELSLADNATNYIYIESYSKRFNDLVLPKITVSQTQPSIRTELNLYKIVTVGGSVTETVDLRYKAKNINLVVDVVAGETDNAIIGSFSTLGEAINYVGALSSEETSIYKIIVKGCTSEPVPIVLSRNGLIIEGVSLEASGLPLTSGISWNFSSGALIDFNGKTDCKFRDLNFILDPTSLSASATLGDMVVFRGSGSRISISDCNFQGSDIASNFVLFEEAYDCIVERCNIEGVSRAGVRNFPGFFCEGITVRDCKISQGSYFPPLTVVSAISFAGSLIPLRTLSRINIDNCTVTGYTRGIYLDAAFSMINNCLVKDTLLEGIIVTYQAFEAYNTISNNTLIDVYTNLVATRIAIDCTKAGNTIDNNHIYFFDPSSTPFRVGIQVQDSSSNKISKNKADGAIVIAIDSTENLVECNEVIALNILSDSNIVIGNYLNNTFTFGSGFSGALVVEGSNNSITSNIIESDVYLLADGNSLTSNVMASNLYVRADECSIVGNRVVTGIVLSDDAAKNIISSNYIIGGSGTGIDIDVNCSYNIVSGNYIRDGIMDISGPYTNISGNNISDAGFGGDVFLNSGSANSIFNANVVFGDVEVNDDQICLSNNWLLGFIRMDGSEYTIMGNKTSSIISTAGTDPDATTGIVLGNHVSSGTIFGVGVAGTAKDHNV